MVANGADPMALVLEDDISIGDHLPQVLEQLERGDAGRFDIIRLHRYKLHRKFVPVRQFGESALGFVRPVDSGTQAYVITREAARRFADAIPKMRQRGDHALYEHWTHGLVACSIDPPVVHHVGQGRSSIGARPLSDQRRFRPKQWPRRKWHQVKKKYIRRRSYYQLLKWYEKNGHLSGL